MESLLQFIVPLRPNLPEGWDNPQTEFGQIAQEAHPVELHGGFFGLVGWVH
jgi:hypothetical protein